MIDYDPKHWWGGVLAWRGTVWPAVLGRVLWLAAFTFLLEIVFYRWPNMPMLNPLTHTLMGVVLGLLLVFRTNSSYDRFWEGRRLWGGLVNASRNLVRGAAAYCPPATDLASLVSAYIRATKLVLCNRKDFSELSAFIPESLVQEAAAAGNPPSILALHISAWLHQRTQAGQLSPNMERLLEGHVSTLVDCQGGCERILKTPIPFVYAVHLRHLTLIYLLTLPFVLVPLMGWGSPLAVAVVTFSLLGIEEAGIEIEDPFGDDPNDLALDDICAVIHRDAQQLAAASERAT